MTRGTWKRSERDIAAMLGGQRVPVSGRARGSAPDIAHDQFSVEVKRRRTVPKWLFGDALAQADASNDGTKTSLVIVEHAPGRGHPRVHYAVLRLTDLLELQER